MIKTVSFAPPRGSKPASGSGNPSSSRATSKRRAPRDSSTGELNLFDSPFVSPSSTSEPEVVASAPTMNAPRSSKRAEVVVEEKPKIVVDEALQTVVDEEKAPEIQTKAPKKPRVKRAIVPTNLAEQYGAKNSRRVENGQVEVPEVDVPKKRLTKVEREARNQLLRVDEGLLERLARAQAIIPTKRAPKPRGWRFDCGRCGAVSHFETPVELCACGAIAVKE